MASFNPEHSTLNHSELALIATFLKHAEFSQKLKNPRFQNYVQEQKDILARLLLQGFELASENNSSSTEVSEKPTTLQAPVDAPVNHREETHFKKVTGDHLLKEITNIFAQMTGYPADMLEPELDFEADLGIDTVKQMEIIGIIREKYQSLNEGFTLKETPTLQSLSQAIENLQVSA